MKILITGCAGFIGSNLSKTLHSQGHFIISVDKLINHNLICDKNYQFDILDINNIPINDCKDIDVIIHLAAEHKDNIKPSDLYYKTNYYGTKKVISFAQKNNINKIIFTSSVAVYGMNINGASESDVPNPFNEYGRSKLKAEKVLNEWYNNDKDRSLIIIRPTVVFGPGNRGNVYNLINQIISKKFIMIGNGENKKSLAFVDNLVCFISKTLKLKSGVFIYNFSDKPDLKMNELIHQIYKSLDSRKNKFHINKNIGLLGGLFFNLLSKLTRYQFSISYIRVKKFISSSIISTNKIKKDFPDLKTIDLKKAISLTIKSDFKKK